MDAPCRSGRPLLSASLCVSLFHLLLSSWLLPCELAAGESYLGAAYVNCLSNVTSLSSTFSRNLDIALRNLTTLSSHGTMYATTTAGSGSGMVYAMFQCRGDQSLDLCTACMQNATVRLPQSDCRHSVGARIQLDGCYLRYDNQSFFELDTGFVQGYCYAPTSDVVALQAIAALMENVTSLAPKQGGFASASESSEYAAAQCLGYLSESDCAACLSRYSYRTLCNMTLGEQLHLGSCYYRFEPYNFLAPLPPPSPAPIPTTALASAPAPLRRSSQPPLFGVLSPPKPSGSKTVALVVGVVIGAVIGTAALYALLVWRYKASRVKGEKRLDKAPSWSGKILQTRARVFSLEELEQATGHFHPTAMLGEGGFGVVYKGTLLSGEQIAVKKLTTGRKEGKQEFLNEVNLITSVQHKNLIRLLGCCVEGPERILVYEYLPNKSLDLFLFGSRTLNWPTRYGIILGTAKGLAYLHEESHVPIIHRDIKPNNILLDEQLNPVIADFGLARLVEQNATHVNTEVAGTMGYVAPEYAIHGDLSEKVDVFSFGLVALEIITGTKNIHSSLLKRVWDNYQQRKALDVMDEKLGYTFSQEQAMRVVHVALLCTQENPKQRPAMSMVTLWLSGTSAILDVPSRPTYLNYSESLAPTGDVNQQSASASSNSWSQAAHSGGQASRLATQVQSFSVGVSPR